MSPTFTTASPHTKLPTPAIHLLYPTYSSGLNTRNRSVLVGRTGGFDAFPDETAETWPSQELEKEGPRNCMQKGYGGYAVPAKPSERGPIAHFKRHPPESAYGWVKAARVYKP